MEKVRLVIHRKDVVDYYTEKEVMKMSESGSDAMLKRQMHTVFDDALVGLGQQITTLEQLLEEIQGADSKPPIQQEVGDSKEAASLMTFLRNGEQRVQLLTDRVASARKGIRESIF